jgi:hypothetical protein
MEFFLTDPDVKKVLPANTHILDLRVEPYPDRKRLRVSLEITPFQVKPFIDLNVTAPDGKIVATTSIVEPVAWKLELTMHIRKPTPTEKEEDTDLRGGYTLSATLSYPDLGEIDHRNQTFQLPQ